VGAEDARAAVVFEGRVCEVRGTAGGVSVFTAGEVIDAFVAFATIKEGEDGVLSLPVGDLHSGVGGVSHGRGSQVAASVDVEGPMARLGAPGGHPGPVYVRHDADRSELSFGGSSGFGDERDDAREEGLRPCAIVFPIVVETC